MARVKRAVNAHKKRRTILENASGYRGQRSRLYRKAKEQLLHSATYQYRALLRSDAEPWHAWCQAAGVALPVPDRGVGYEDMGVMLQSAIDGQGIMLARRTIAAMDLAKGTLVQLFDIAAPSASSYWIVWPEDPPPSDRALAFRDWLVDEVARSIAPRTARSRRASNAESRVDDAGPTGQHVAGRQPADQQPAAQRPDALREPSSKTSSSRTTPPVSSNARSRVRRPRSS